MVTNKAEWREKSEKTVKTRLQRQMREEEYSEEIELKFESFKKFLIRKGTSNKMTNTFFWRRFFTALIVSTNSKFSTYVITHAKVETWTFHLKIPWNSSNFDIIINDCISSTSWAILYRLYSIAYTELRSIQYGRKYRNSRNST